MRKLLLILIATALLTMAVTDPAEGAYSGYVSIDTVKAHPGDHFSVPVRLHANTAAFSALMVPVRYNSPYLTLDSVSFAGTLLNGSFSGIPFDDQARRLVRISYVPLIGSVPPPTISASEGSIAVLFFSLSIQATSEFIEMDSANIDSFVVFNGDTIVNFWTGIALSNNTGDTVYYPGCVAGGVEVLVPTGIADGQGADGLPREFALAQNYPNPFNPTTEIEFAVPRASDIRLDVFNILGQSVATLFSGRAEAGIHRVTFDAAKYPSGIYFYRLLFDGGAETKKMVLVK